jgi:tRNA pseudouridine38-40 synthase
MRCLLLIAYNGTSFLGSQIQTQTTNTVLGTLELALSQLGIHSRVIASGRTDKGVHATGQVCHVDLPEFWTSLNKLKKVLNQMLPSSIQVKNVMSVTKEFHARYSAKKRVYRYLIKNSKSNPFENEFVTFLEYVDYEEVKKNIKLFIGEHDFKNFMKTGSDVKSTTRTIYKAFAYKHKDYIVLNFEANGYLRSQIRVMIGALLKLKTNEIKDKLTSKNNYKIKPAPANGLYLAKVKY